MTLTKEKAARELQTRDSLFVAYSQATRLPYVTCDEESYNDQVWIFSTEEGLKKFAQEKFGEKILLAGTRFDKKDFNRLYVILFSIDVNSIMYVDGEEQVEVELSMVARQPDYSKIEENRRPLFNPAFQLCAIYFMQELRRPRSEKDARPNLRDQEEELLVNLRKAQFLVPMEASPEDPKKISVPYLKAKNGDVLQPVFTDVLELERFARGKKLRAAKVPFDKLPGILIEQAKALVINPMGINLVLDRDQLTKIAGLS